jgi:hypothetical protein
MFTVVKSCALDDDLNKPQPEGGNMAIEVTPALRREISAAPVSKLALWTGRTISALVVLALVVSAVMKFKKAPEVIDGLATLGYPESLALGLGMLELACTFVYALPRTAVLGAVLLTGYFGGAISTHVRVGDPFVPPVFLAMLAWVGLYLRDPRLRALLPGRTDPSLDGAPGRGRTSRFRKILVGVVTVVVVLAIFIALQPGSYRVVRSATIAVTPAEVFAQVNDFHNWEAWSPWAKLDPACKNTFEGASAGTGAVFVWNGNDKVGEGRMTLLESRPDELICIKLDFIRPFASTCAVEFAFQPQGKETKVTWSMNGEKNFLSKAFCLFMDMDKMLGGDFEKGLAQMKAVAEGSARK